MAELCKGKELPKDCHDFFMLEDAVYTEFH